MYIVRHCQSEANVKHIWGMDPPLSALGREQAEEIPKIETSLVIASRLRRAQETARIVYPDRKIIVMPEFNEIHFGKHEGSSLACENPELARFYYSFPHLMHFFSKGDDVTKRADEAIEIMRALPKDAVIFSHQCLIRCILARLNGDIGSAEYMGVSNGEVIRIDFSPQLSIESLT